MNIASTRTWRHLHRCTRNALVILACALIAGIMAVGGDVAFMVLGPWLTSAMSRFGWTNRTISDVSIDVDDAAILLILLLAAIGLVATLVALLLVGPWYQRKPRWTRAIRAMLPALAIGLVPWTFLTGAIEAASFALGQYDRGAFLSIVYAFGGPIVSLFLYRLARDGVRRWKLRTNPNHVPREPCSTCGYELLMTHAAGGLKRCPECGAEQPLKNLPQSIESADF